MGCSIFLLPVDIVEVNPKMILTLTASIMLWSLSNQTGEDTSTMFSELENGLASANISAVDDDSASLASLLADNGSKSQTE